MIAARRALLILACAGLLACASADSGQRAAERNTYLRYVTFEVPVNERVLLRWQTRQMPLRVHLPRPPAGMFEDDDAVWESVRDGVTDWTDVVGPGLPHFRFVDAPGDADIPVVWADEPDGDWYVAHCAYDINVMTRRFGVSRILVTARWQDGSLADVNDVYDVMLHEMGHALGLTGHSPHSEDVMFAGVQADREPGLSARDRATLRALYRRPIGSRVAGARSSR